MNNIENYNEFIFEKIKHIDESGNEYWEARELQKVLNYSQWRRFYSVIEKAKTSCVKSNNDIFDHFANIGKMVETGDSVRRIDDYKLSRYACYLIAQNGDSRKKVIALAQTYFAVQTRTIELLEKEYYDMSEDEKRLYQRSLTRKGNFSLNQTTSKAGVKNFDKFHNAGYKGLYNGETADDIAKRKGLRYREDILDNMGSEELADNLFRIVQTESRIKNEKIIGEGKATETHYEMGRSIRDFIKIHGGTMPEDLPTPDKSLKDIGKNKYIDK